MPKGAEAAGKLATGQKGRATRDSGGVTSARRCAGLSGIAFVVLFGLGNALWWPLKGPGSGAPAAEIVDFYGNTSGRIIVGGSLSLLAIAAFVLFAAAVRQVLIEAGDDDVLATTGFGGALLVVAVGLGAETINMVGALRARDKELSDALAQSLFEISRILGSTAGSVGIAVFALSTAAVAIRSGRILPRWLAIGTGVIGISLLTPLSLVTEVPGVAMVLLTSIIAVVLLRTPVEGRSLTNDPSGA
jgi:hypothetical protein